MSTGYTRIRLVGGPMDERMLDVRDDVHELRVPEAPEFTATAETAPSAAKPGYVIHVYRRQDAHHFVYDSTDRP